MVEAFREYPISSQDSLVKVVHIILVMLLYGVQSMFEGSVCGRLPSISLKRGGLLFLLSSAPSTMPFDGLTSTWNSTTGKPPVTMSIGRPLPLGIALP